MKLLHISDLHLGRRLGEYRLLAEQSALLDWVLETAVSQEADGILLAGDIYDRSVPPVEAVTLFDTFLTRLSGMNIPLFAISGNHDSAERISYGSRLLDGAGIHFSALYDGSVRRVLLEKDGQRAYIHLLPFLRPVHVAASAPEETGEPARSMSYTEAMAQALSRMELPGDGANILLCHQFITGSLRSESEEVPIAGTLDAVDAAVFRDFDYVALGHLHRAQRVTDTIRYCGTLMPFSFSETDTKGCLLAEVRGKEVSCTFLPVPEGLTRTLTTLTGTYDTLAGLAFRESCPHTEDYLRIVLEEDTPVPDAMARLSVVYPRIVQLAYRRHTEALQDTPAVLAEEGARPLSPEEVFASFYARQNDAELSEDDRTYLRSLLAELEGGAVCGR